METGKNTRRPDGDVSSTTMHSLAALPIPTSQLRMVNASILSTLIMQTVRVFILCFIYCKCFDYGKYEKSRVSSYLNTVFRFSFAPFVFGLFMLLMLQPENFRCISRRSENARFISCRCAFTHQGPNWQWQVFQCLHGCIDVR